MTESRKPDRHVPGGSDPITKAVHDARHGVSPISGDALVGAVTSSMTRRRQRQRRLVVGAVACAAAILLVAVAFIGLASGDRTTQVATQGKDTKRSDAQLSKAMAFCDPTAGKNDCFNHVIAGPAVDLEDGQSISVTAFGFDIGTDVTFIQCVNRQDDRSSGPATTIPATGLVPTTADLDAPDKTTYGPCSDTTRSEPTPSVKSDNPSQAESKFNQSQRADTTMHVSRLVTGSSISSDGSKVTPPRPTDPAGVTCTGPSLSSTRPPEAVAKHMTFDQCVILAVGTINGRRAVVRGALLSFDDDLDYLLTLPTSGTGSTAGGPGTSAPANSSPTSVPVGSSPPSTADCPAPITSRPADVSTLNNGKLVDFKPTQIIFCSFAAQIVAPTSFVVTDPTRVAQITTELNLPAPSPSQSSCETGPDSSHLYYNLLVSGGTHSTYIHVETGECAVVSNDTSAHLGNMALSDLLNRSAP